MLRVARVDKFGGRVKERLGIDILHIYFSPLPVPCFDADVMGKDLFFFFFQQLKTGGHINL